jgi:chaperonin GroES
LSYPLKPLDNKVVVRRKKPDEFTEGGIALPDTAKGKHSEGEVLAVGPGKLKDDGTRAPMQVKVGDHVYFTYYAGDETKSLGEDVVLMREEDILCVKDKESPVQKAARRGFES